MSDAEYQEALKQAKERKRKLEDQQALEAGSSHSQSAGQANKTGKQQANTAPSSAPQPTPITPAIPSAPSSTAQSAVTAEPHFLLEYDYIKQVITMNFPSIKALATALEIDVDSKSKMQLMMEIIRFCGTCKSVKSFDVDSDSFEFEDLVKQDFQQPAAQ